MKTRLSKKSYIVIYTILFLLAASFILSATLYKIKDYGSRRTFIFPSVDNRLIVETRYLAPNPLKSDINYYIDELLLGSGVERTKLLFSPETRLLSCMEKDDVVYINLSDDLLKMGDNVIEIKEGVELLKTNIIKNFRNIKKVEIFVNGVYAYEDSSAENK